MSLTQQEIEQAESAANAVITEVFGNIDSVEFPIDLNIVLERYGLTLKKGPFGDPNISGAYSRDKREVYVANNESLERQAFTVAHEIGHYKLHEDVETDVMYRGNVWSFDGNTKEEQMANWFGASLLMPSEAVRKLWETTKDVGRLASVFGVSRSAMYFRLKNLGLIT